MPLTGEQRKSDLGSAGSKSGPETDIGQSGRLLLACAKADGAVEDLPALMAGIGIAAAGQADMPIIASTGRQVKPLGLVGFGLSPP